MIPWLYHLFGLGNLSGSYYGFWSGAGSDIAELAIVGGLIDVARRMVKHHRERLAQGERHHAEHLAQLLAHHNEMKHLHAKHHQRALDQADAHHESAKAHLTAMLRLPVKTPRAPAGGGGGGDSGVAVEVTPGKQPPKSRTVGGTHG